MHTIVQFGGMPHQFLKNSTTFNSTDDIANEAPKATESRDVALFQVPMHYHHSLLKFGDKNKKNVQTNPAIVVGNAGNGGDQTAVIVPGQVATASGMTPQRAAKTAATIQRMVEKVEGSVPKEDMN